MVTLVEPALQRIDPAAIRAAAVPLDFLGINYYTRILIAAAETAPFFAQEVRPAGLPYTAMGWEVYPEGLRALLVRVWREYGPPAIYITENGAAYDDPDVAEASSKTRSASATINYTWMRAPQRWPKVCRCVDTSPGA